MRRTRFKPALVALATMGMATTGLACSSEAGSGGATYTLAGFLPEDSGQGQMYEQWAKRIEDRSDGDVKIQLHHAGSLLAADAILSGVGSGRADFGAPSPGYHPTELPLSQVVSLPFVTRNIPAQASALQELYEENDAFHEEYEKLMALAEIPQ